MEIAEILTEFAERAEYDSMLQKMLKKVKLRPPFDVLEYVKPINKKGFWRRKPHWREHPSIQQAEARLELSETAYSLYGERGVVERSDGTRIPRESYLVGESMRGRKFVSEEAQAERRRLEIIERIAQAVVA